MGAGISGRGCGDPDSSMGEKCVGVSACRIVGVED